MGGYVDIVDKVVWLVKGKVIWIIWFSFNVVSWVSGKVVCFVELWEFFVLDNYVLDKWEWGLVVIDWCMMSDILFRYWNVELGVLCRRRVVFKWDCVIVWCKDVVWDNLNVWWWDFRMVWYLCVFFRLFLIDGRLM